MLATRGHRVNHAINALRTTAALTVVLGHARILLFRDWDNVPHTALNQALYGVTAIGHQAVIVFFVLSGYWVGGAVVRAAHQGRFAWSTYLPQRLIRLWIVLVPALVLTAACDLLGRHFFPTASVYNYTPGYAGVIVTAPRPLGLIGFLGNAALQMPFRVLPYGSNTALWSLGYEFWFYIIFPLAICTIVAIRHRPRLVTFGCLTLAAAALAGTTILSYFPLWILGAVIAWQAPAVGPVLDRMRPSLLLGLRVAASAVLLVAAVVVRGINTLPVVLGDYLVAIPTALLLVLLVRDLQPQRPWIRRPLLATSRYADSSYSLYCIHVPMLVLFAAATGTNVDSRWPVDLAHGLIYLLLIVCVLALAWLFAWATEHRTDRARAALIRALPTRRVAR